MSRINLSLFILAAILLLILPPTLAATSPDSWSENEWHLIQSFSLDNLPGTPVDPSNQYLNEPGAVLLGKQLFFDTKLSKNGAVACSSCHQPVHLFTDKLVLGKGLEQLRRHTPTIINSAYLNWFFWDGRKDSLWSQALSPLEDNREHGLSRIEVIRLIAENASYRQQYENLFSVLPTTSTIKSWPEHARPEGDQSALLAWKSLSQQNRKTIDRILSNIGKSLAAYVATLKTGPSRLDHYIQEINASGESGILSDIEKQGLRLFISQKATCTNCHSGPLLTNQGFHNIGTAVPGQDMGRSEIVDAIQWDRFNCLGEYSDAGEDDCSELRYMNKSRHQYNGAFKTPGLRNVADTAPYMHDGRFSSLSEVLDHYLEVSASPSNHLAKITLSADEKQQLIAFLKTLSEINPG